MFSLLALSLVLSSYDCGAGEEVERLAQETQVPSGRVVIIEGVVET